MNKNTVLTEINRHLGEGMEAKIVPSVPEAKTAKRAGTSVKNVVFSLVRLLDGEWVKIGPLTGSNVSSVSQAARKEGLDAMSRSNGNGADVYMRLAGGPTE
jgi:hypothetical protein